jgi:cold shock CspA family protein
MEGTVKFFNRRKGFGFISGDDGKDYFVHFTALAEGTFLRDNDKVSFEAADGEKGLKAEKITLLEKASDRSDLPAEGEEAPAEAPATEEAPVEETPAEAPATEEAPVEETPAEEPATEEAPVEEKPAEEPATEEAPVEETPAEAPAEEEPKTE